MAYLLDKLLPEDFELIKSRKFVEISDLWRLLKLYHEGGIYMDINRLCDQPLSKIITSPAVKYVLPTFLDTDFSQDIMISCSRNPIIARAIELNLQRRRAGEVDIMTLGPHSYFHAITEVLTGRRLERKRNNRLVLNEMRALINQTDCLTTFREIPPFYTILYRGPEVKIDKDMLYKRDDVTHWQS
jgi:mannosyltransferase OCH1-like enzyme